MADGLNGNKWKIFLDISAILYYHKNDQNGVTGSSKISKKLLKNMPGKPFLRYVRMLRKMPGAMMKGAMNMKRILSLISTALLLVIVFAVPVSAVIYTSEEYYDFRNSFTEIIQLDGNVVAIFSFLRGPFDGVAASLYMGEGCTSGRTFVQISCNGGEIRTASSHQIEDNQITCGAGLTNRSYTTKTNHYAARECNGVATIWDYYRIDPNHDANSVLDTKPSGDIK